MAASTSASRFSRRRLLGASALGVASLGGLATVLQSTTAHDDHDEGHQPGTPAASPMASPAMDPNVFVIETHDTFYTPKDLAIPADTEVTLKIVNKGLMQHDWVCEPLKLTSGRLNAGDEVELQVTAPKGSYQFYCSVPGHKILGMVGILKVA
jgi:nitrite reductase (NO-forming)